MTILTTLAIWIGISVIIAPLVGRAIYVGSNDGK